MSLATLDTLGNVLWLALVAFAGPSAVIMNRTVHRSRLHMLTNRVLEISHPLMVPVVVISTVLDLITVHSVAARVFDLIGTLVFLGINWAVDAFSPCPTCRTGLWKRAWQWLWRPLAVPQHSF